MNKEELIAILQERSQESINGDLYENEEPTTSDYLKKISVRRKSDKNSFTLIFFLVISLTALGFVSYKLFGLNKIVQSNSYIKKDSIVFENLKLNTQEKYVLKDVVSKYQEKLNTFDKTYIKQLEQKESKLKKDIKNVKKELTSLLIKNKSLKKQLINSDKETINKTKLKKYKHTGCYNEEAGSNAITKACKTKITNFLKKNNKALKYEIIAISDQKDKQLIDNRINQINTNKVEKTLLKKYLTEGLARTRVLEGAWLIKKELGNKALITYVNYIAETSQKRGFTIRAYSK